MLIKTLKHPLFLILLVAVILRGINLNKYPALNPDEAALGYNAFSLIQTGKDEHGIAWPIHFKSFGDYKPGGYVYLLLPIIKLFGLNVFAVRLPNLIFATLTIVILYKLVELLSKSKNLALLSALVLTLSPWHIYFSRGAWESSTALFFLLSGIYFFYLFIIQSKQKHILISIFLLVSSLYIYHSVRIIAPSIILILTILERKSIIANYKKLVFPIIFGIIITLPVLGSFLTAGGTSRFNSVGLTADKGPLLRSEELLSQHPQNNLLTRLTHNQRLLYAISFSQKYLSHFDPGFLFLSGDEVPRSKVPDMGQLYIFELPLVLIGIFGILKTKTLRFAQLIAVLLVIAPLASSLTFQAPSALRSLPLAIPLAILTAVGIHTLISYGHNKFMYLFIFIVYSFGAGYFLDAYFTHYQKRYPFAWNYGFSELVPYINSQKNNYSHVYVTDKYDQPYILYLFFSHYPPYLIQPQIHLTPPDQFGFSTVTQIDNITFGPINWNNVSNNSLVIAANDQYPGTLIKTINFPNHQPGFKIYVK